LAPFFVFYELQPILNVRQNRLEMGEHGGECLSEFGQNRHGWVTELNREERLGASVAVPSSPSTQRHRRRAYSFLPEPT